MFEEDSEYMPSSYFQDTRAKLKKPFELAQQKQYALAGKYFLIMWQDVQTKQQSLYSTTTEWYDEERFTSNNSASILIKQLEELGISLIRDAAMAFVLAVDESFDEKNLRRYEKQDDEKKQDNETSPWPKTGLEMKYNGKPFDKGIGIDLILEDLKHPLDILLKKCTTNRDVAYFLSCYYFRKRGSLTIEGYFSADVECIYGNTGRVSKENRQKMLEHALERASESSDIGHKEWIKACINKAGL